MIYRRVLLNETQMAYKTYSVLLLFKITADIIDQVLAHF